MSETKVELHQAFLWTCDECGRDNFERAVTLALESISPEDRAAIAEAIGDMDGCYMAAPTSVKCPHCGAEFGVVDYADD